jgi:hypothetical protein
MKTATPGWRREGESRIVREAGAWAGRAHERLAYHLGVAGGDRAETLAHWLAAAVLYQFTDLDRGLDRLVSRMPRRDASPAGTHLPRTLAEVIQVAERTDGVYLRALIATLEPDSEAAAAAFGGILGSLGGARSVAALGRTAARRASAELSRSGVTSDSAMGKLADGLLRWLIPGDSPPGDEEP